jgi:hypothetical protein
MGAPNAFNERRVALQALLQREIADEEIMQSFIEEILKPEELSSIISVYKSSDCYFIIFNQNKHSNMVLLPRIRSSVVVGLVPTIGHGILELLRELFVTLDVLFLVELTPVTHEDSD